MTRASCVAAVVLAFAASGCEKPGFCGGKALLVEVSGNHGHTERLEPKALEKGPGRYVLEGASHEHTFRLAETDVAKLKSGEALELRSTSMNAHLHELRLKCEK